MVPGLNPGNDGFFLHPLSAREDVERRKIKGNKHLNQIVFHFDNINYQTFEFSVINLCCLYIMCIVSFQDLHENPHRGCSVSA